MLTLILEQEHKRQSCNVRFNFCKPSLTFKMFRFVLFVVLAVGYIESITIDEVYQRVKLLEYSVAQLKAQNEALQNRDVELEMKLRESAEELRRELDQVYK